MAGNKRTVEFIFRGKDELTSIVKKVTGAFGGVAKAQDELSQAIADGNPRYAALKAQAAQLADAYTEFKAGLTGVASALKQQERIAEITKDLRDQEAAVENATKAQQEAAGVAAKAAAEYAKQATELKALKTQLAELATRQKQLGDAAGIVEQWERLSASLAALQKRQAGVRQESSRLTVVLREQELAFGELKAAGATKDTLAVFEAQIRQTRGAIAALNKELSSTGKTKGVEQQIASIVGDLDRLSVSAKKAGVETTDLLKPLDQLQGEAAQVAQRIEQTRLPLQRMEGSLIVLGRASKEAAGNLKEADLTLAKAQGEYGRTEKKVHDLSAALAPLEKTLRDAGIATDRLSDEQVRLKASLGNTQKKAKDTATAIREIEQESKAAAAAQKRGFEMQRSSLSLLQRFRGQILGMTAAYVGLYGVVNQVTQAFAAGGRQRGIENTFAAVNRGDTQAAAEELEYTRRLADELGQEYLSLADSYSKYRAAIGDKLPLEQQRFLFEAVAKSATVMRLSTEDAEGTFRALGQIFSKGKITAEELRQQLGDRLPGAMRLLSEGLGITEAELNKLMETGNLTAENMLFFAKAANTAFGEGLAKALQTPQAQLNRIINRVTDLRIAFEKAAEDAGLGQVLKGIADALSNPAATKAVEQLARGLVGMLKTLPGLIEQFDVLLGVAQLLIVGGLVTWLNKAAAASRAYVPIMVALTTAMQNGASAVKVFGAALLGAVGMGIALYSVLTDLVATNAQFRKFAVIVGGVLVRAWEQLTFAVQMAANQTAEAALGVGTSLLYTFKITQARLKAFLLNGLATLDSLVTEGLSKLVGGAAKLADAIGLDETAAKLRGVMVKNNENLVKTAAKANAEVEALEKEKGEVMLRYAGQFEKDREALRAKERENEQFHQKTLAALAEEGSRKQTAAAGSVLTGDIALGKPKLPTEDAKKSKGEKALEKSLDDLLNEVRNKMAEIATAVARGTTDTLSNQFDAIRAEYVKLAEDIASLVAAEKLTPQEAETYLTTIEKRQAQQRKVAQREWIREGAAATEDLFSARDQAITSRQDSGEITSLQADRERQMLREEMFWERQRAAQSALRIAEQEMADALATEDATAIARAQAKLEVEQQYADAVGKSREELDKQLFTADEINNKLADGLTGVGDALARAVAEGEGLSGAFKAAGDAFRQFAADFLRDIARVIMRTAILKALQGAFGGAKGGLGGIISDALGKMHSGGIVGRKPANRTARVDPTWFANATRYHSGGIVGLAPDEVPAILQRGEEVLSKSSARNVLNGGGAAVSTQQRPQDIQIVNAIDPTSLSNAVMSTPETKRAIINIVRSDRATFRTLLGVS